MAFYTGPAYTIAEVSIGTPAAALLQEGTARPFEGTDWFVEASGRADICYFSINHTSSLVGQIFLHDMDPAVGESLIGYHIFDAAQRGRGIGTKALTLLKRFVVEETELRRLIIITSRDNPASQAIARKCGFACTGASREDPENGVVFERSVPRAGDDSRDR